MFQRVITNGLHQSRSVDVTHYGWTVSMASRDETSIRSYFESFVGNKGTVGGAYPLQVLLNRSGDLCELPELLVEQWEELLPEILKDVTMLTWISVIIWKGVWKKLRDEHASFTGDREEHMCILT